jgi:hypothetical protein
MEGHGGVATSLVIWGASLVARCRHSRRWPMPAVGRIRSGEFVGLGTLS